MSDLPDTIKYPENFKKSQWQLECPYCNRVIGFDGVFNWAWTQGCFGESKIAPMDFDGVIERHKHYFVFETKDVGVPISQAQVWTLDRLIEAKTFTVMKLWGKDSPQKFIMKWPDGKDSKEYQGVEMARKILTKWYRWADENACIEDDDWDWLGLMARGIK